MSQLLDKAKNFVAEKVANIKKPEATINDVDFKRVSRESVEYLAKVSVTNPYGHPIPICEISYTLKSAGRFDLIHCYHLCFDL
jgi:LEA14-like dessication related protein